MRPNSASDTARSFLAPERTERCGIDRQALRPKPAAGRPPFSARTHLTLLGRLYRLTRCRGPAVHPRATRSSPPRHLLVARSPARRYCSEQARQILRCDGGLPANDSSPGGNMAISADLLDAPSRPVTPAELIREVVPDQPVILVGPSATWEAFGVTAWLEERGWSWTHAADAERARWLTAIQKVSLVLVAGDERTVWKIVEAIRPVTMAPLVVLARPAPAGVISLVGAGVDAVVDPTCGAEEVFARVVALVAPVGPRLGARRPLPRRRRSADRPLGAGVRPPWTTPAPLAHGVRAPHVPHDAPTAGVARAHDRAPGVGMASVGRQEHPAHLRQPSPAEARRRSS